MKKSICGADCDNFGYEKTYDTSQKFDLSQFGRRHRH